LRNADKAKIVVHVLVLLRHQLFPSPGQT